MIEIKILSAAFDLQYTELTNICVDRSCRNYKSMLVNDANYVKVLPKIICSNKRIVYSEESLYDLIVVNSN